MQASALSTAANAANPNSATAKKSAINSDFNTFLKMLTTQIKNQDPTNPMDSADFAVQLATFSGVEQQVKTNDMLNVLSSQFGVMGMSQLAAWVGQEARAPSPVYLGNSDVTLTYASSAGADRAVLSVRDAKGTVVGREDVSVGTGPFQWSGNDLQGKPLPNGKYTLSLESYQGERKLGEPTQVEAYSRIEEARSGPNGTVLVLQGGIEVAATVISALRVAGSGGAASQANTNSGGQASGTSATAGANANAQTGAQNGSGVPASAQNGSGAPANSTDGDIFATLDENGQPIPETYTPD